MKTELTDAQLMQLCSGIPLEKIQEIAVKYMGFDLSEIQIYKEKFPRDETMVKCSLLETWRNRNYPHSREKLLNIMKWSACDGFVHPKTFAFFGECKHQALVEKGTYFLMNILCFTQNKGTGTPVLHKDSCNFLGHLKFLYDIQSYALNIFFYKLQYSARTWEATLHPPKNCLPHGHFAIESVQDPWQLMSITLTCNSEPIMGVLGLDFEPSGTLV